MLIVYFIFLSYNNKKENYMKINNHEYHGLSSKEVAQRINVGKINEIDNRITKSYKEIFLNNTITFFNILNISLFALIVFVGSYNVVVLFGGIFLE